MKIIMIKLLEDKMYASIEGYRMTREYGETPNGNPVNGRWVLRDPKGEWIDMDQYRHDLAEWHGLRLTEPGEYDVVKLLEQGVAS